MFFTDSTVSRALMVAHGLGATEVNIGDWHVQFVPTAQSTNVTVYGMEDYQYSTAQIIDGSLFWIIGIAGSNQAINLIPDMTLDDPAYDAPLEVRRGAMFILGCFDFELGEVHRRGYRDHFNIMVFWALNVSP